jgi:hypothetical protein
MDNKVNKLICTECDASIVGLHVRRGGAVFCSSMCRKRFVFEFNSSLVNEAGD